MKNYKYVTPEMEVLSVSAEDVLTASFTADEGEIGIDAGIANFFS